MAKTRVVRRRTGRRVRRSEVAASQKASTTLNQAVKVLSGGSGTEGALATLYVVQPTDTPDRIADRFSILVERFIDVNPEVACLNRVFTGQIVEVPLTPPILPVVNRVATEYVVQEGETLFTIAQQFRIGLAALQRANPLATPDRIFAGQLLLIPTVAEPPPMAYLLYVVQPGDTPTMVAGLFGVSAAALAAANPQRANPARFYAGEIIVLPVAGVPEKPVFDTVRYVVQPMESVEEVAQHLEVWLPGLERLNAVVAPIPGLLLQMPASMPAPAPPQTPDDEPATRPIPFGRRLDLGDDDAVFVAFPAELQFTFYGQSYSNGVWVSSNGNVTLGEADPTYFATTDAFIEGQPRLAPFWTDLVPPAAVGTGGVYVNTVFEPALEGTRMAITFDRVPVFGIEQFHTFQMILNPDGSIVYAYYQVQPMPADAPRVLVGVAPGGSKQGSQIFLYNGTDNQHRAGDLSLPVPAGSLSGRVMLYRYDNGSGTYKATLY